MKLSDARLIVGSVGAFRATQITGRSVSAAAGVPTQLAKNDTPFPLTVIVHSLILVSSAFGPLRDSVAGATAIVRPVNVNAGQNSTSFILRPYGELWVTPIGVANTYRVTEMRV